MAAQPALAQRADENAATSAEDGFGKSVGDESVGIYASGNVRGFSAYLHGYAQEVCPVSRPLKAESAAIASTRSTGKANRKV